MEPAPSPATRQSAEDLIVEDLLADSFPLIRGEAEWWIELLGSEMMECLNDRFDASVRLSASLDQEAAAE